MGNFFSNLVKGVGQDFSNLGSGVHNFLNPTNSSVDPQSTAFNSMLGTMGTDISSLFNGGKAYSGMLSNPSQNTIYGGGTMSNGNPYTTSNYNNTSPAGMSNGNPYTTSNNAPITMGSYNPASLSQSQRQYLWQQNGHSGQAPVGYGGEGNSGSNGTGSSNLNPSDYYSQAMSYIQPTVNAETGALSQEQKNLPTIYGNMQQTLADQKVNDQQMMNDSLTNLQNEFNTSSGVIKQAFTSVLNNTTVQNALSGAGQTGLNGQSSSSDQNQKIQLANDTANKLTQLAQNTQGQQASVSDYYGGQITQLADKIASLPSQQAQVAAQLGLEIANIQGQGVSEGLTYSSSIMKYMGDYALKQAQLNLQAGNQQIAYQQMLNSYQLGASRNSISQQLANNTSLLGALSAAKTVNPPATTTQTYKPLNIAGFDLPFGGTTTTSTSQAQSVNPSILQSLLSQSGG